MGSLGAVLNGEADRIAESSSSDTQKNSNWSPADQEGEGQGGRESV